MPGRNDDDDPPRNRPWNRSRGNDRDENDDRPRRRRDEDDEDDRPQRRRSRDDDDDYDHDHPRRRKEASNGLAVAGLILGVLSFCTFGLAGIPGVICSAIALGKPTGRGLAVAGLLIGIVGTLVGAGLAVWVGGEIWEKIKFGGSRAKDANNLKQIGIGLHTQQNRNWGMSAPYAQDERGVVNRDLSFRVSLLQHVEQESLYRKFDMTQPWNSPRNQPHANTPVTVYASPFEGQNPSTNTPYRVFYGGGALFNEDGKPVPLTQVTDGTSNTIMMVHAAEQVPWAEAREFRYSPNTPLPALGQSGGGNVLMADGAVRFVGKNVSERTMRRAITRADGEPLGGDW